MNDEWLSIFGYQMILQFVQLNSILIYNGRAFHTAAVALYYEDIFGSRSYHKYQYQVCNVNVQ